MNTLLTSPTESTTARPIVPTLADRLALRLGRWLVAHAERPRPPRHVPQPVPRTVADDARAAHALAVHHAQAFGRWN